MPPGAPAGNASDRLRRSAARSRLRPRRRTARAPDRGAPHPGRRGVPPAGLPRPKDRGRWPASAAAASGPSRGPRQSSPRHGPPPLPGRRRRSPCRARSRNRSPDGPAGSAPTRTCREWRRTLARRARGRASSRDSRRRAGRSTCPDRRRAASGARRRQRAAGGPLASGPPIAPGRCRPHGVRAWHSPDRSPTAAAAATPLPRC